MFVIAPIHLTDDQTEVDEIRKDRTLACEEANEKVDALPVESFRTYLNAVGRVYTHAANEGLVMSSRRQLPGLQNFLTEVITRSCNAKVSRRGASRQRRPGRRG